MELVNYLRIVRRRWRLVAVFLIIGLALGIGSGAIAGGTVKGPGPTYYLAKHTLSSSTGTANLARDAALCTEGEVPKRVAAKLDLDDPNAIAGRIVCEPHPETNLLYVAATDIDNKQSVLLADTFAEQLVLYLRDVGDTLKQTEIDKFNKQIGEMKSEAAEIQARQTSTTDPLQKELDASRLQEITKQINTTEDRKNAALAAPAVTESLTTLSTAEAVPISQGAFQTLVNGDPKAATAKGGSPTQQATRQSQIDAAIKSGNPITLPSRAALGAGLGLLLGFALAIVLDRVDPRIRTKFEAEEAFGWPVIGEIPPLTRRERQQLTVFAYDEPRSRSAEAYRVLRSAVLFSHMSDEALTGEDVHPIFAARPNAQAEDAIAHDPSADATADTTADGNEDSLEVSTAAAFAHAHDREGKPSADDDADRIRLSGEVPEKPRGQVIMVTSPGPSEGKTTTAANLAAILAETGRSVIVVNCDFRRPRIHLHLDAPNEPRKVVETKIANVKLVSQVLENPNDANPALVLQTQRQVVRNAREMFDIVLLDTAPLLTTNDATDVLSVADQVIIVVKSGKTHKEAADRAAELLERRKGPVLGVILVGATDVPTSRYYYYGDSPEAEEPLPGTETASPFDALLTDVIGTPSAAAAAGASDADLHAAKVFAGAPAPDTSQSERSGRSSTKTSTSTTDAAAPADQTGSIAAEDTARPPGDATEAPSGNGATTSNGTNGSKRSRRSSKPGGGSEPTRGR